MSWVIEPKTLGARVEEFLRARHPIKTAANVAAETDGRCSAFQVGKWLEGASAPNGAAMAALIATYGPEFLAAIIPSPPAWLDAALRAQRAASIEAEIARRQREIDELKSAAL